MQAHEENKNRSVELLTLGGADCAFHLFSIHADGYGVRIAICEFVLGERVGALFGFLVKKCPDCGTEVGMDLFWTGLCHG